MSITPEFARAIEDAKSRQGEDPVVRGCRDMPVCVLGGEGRPVVEDGRTYIIRQCDRDDDERTACECKKCGGIRGLVVETGSGLGDALIGSGAIRSAHHAYPKLPIRVVTGHAAVFDHSPDVDAVVRRPHKDALLAGEAKDWRYVHLTHTEGRCVPKYGEWLKARPQSDRRAEWSDWNDDPDVVLFNTVTAATHLLNEQAGLHIRRMTVRPALYLTDKERSERPLGRPYWLIASGAEGAKEPRVELLNGIVAAAKGIHWIQMGCAYKRGKWGTNQPDIAGVSEDRRGKMDLRELFRWVFHARGVVCPEGGLMHVSGAVGTPCIVLSGGRATPNWHDYPQQSFIHTIGKLDCCRTRGCWQKGCPWDRRCYLEIDPAQVAEIVHWHDRHQAHPFDLAQPREREAPNGSPFSVQDIRDWYRPGPGHAFLVCPGPSLRDVPIAELDGKGIVTMAVNRAVHALARPTFFIMCDDWKRYPSSVWNNPTLVKFVHSKNAAFLRSWPQLVNFDWDRKMPPSAMLAGPKIVQGLHGYGDNGTSMFAAIGILVRLGFRTINIVGADFHMPTDGSPQYGVPHRRPPEELKQYPSHFDTLNSMFRDAMPILTAAGVTVWNCTPGGHMTDAVPRRPFADAVQEARDAL